MNSLRKLFSTTILILALAASAMADDGIIHGDRSPTPTPTPIIDPATGLPQAYNGNATDGSADPANTTDAAYEVTLRVVGELFAIY